MSRESLLEIIQKLPQSLDVFNFENDPIALHLNEVAARSRGAGALKSALTTYQTMATELSDALLQYRKQRMNKMELDNAIKSAMTHLEENLASDFLIAAVYQSGGIHQRILLAHQIGLISEDHLDWSKVITQQRTNVLNIFIHVVKDLQRKGLNLEPLTLEDSAETFTTRFQQLIELLQRINNFIASNAASTNSELSDIRMALNNSIKTIYESWLKPLMVVPRFYDALLLKLALSKQLEQAKENDTSAAHELNIASAFAKDHGYEFDDLYGVFRSKQPKRAT